MPNVKIVNFEGKVVGERSLADSIFGAPLHVPAMHQVVVAQLANKRQGTHAAQDRSDVRGGGKKPYKQKHTGRARRGSMRSPINVGGGVAHGPHPRDYSQKVNKKVRALAMRSALSLRAREEKLVLVENPVMEKPRTKSVVAFLESVGAGCEKTLIIVHESNLFLRKSAGSIEGTRVLHVDSLNVYDILHHKHLIMTPEAAQIVEEVFGR